MSGSIGKLVLQITADQTALQSGLDGATSAIDAAGRSMGATLDRVGGTGLTRSIRAATDAAKALSAVKPPFDATAEAMKRVEAEKQRLAVQKEYERLTAKPPPPYWKQFADGLASIGKDPLGWISGAIGRVKALGKAMSSTIGGIINLPSSANSAVQSFFDFFTGADTKFTEIVSIGRLSDKLGIDTEMLAALKANGLGLDELERGARALSRAIMGVRIEGEDTTGKLEKFGVQTEKLAHQNLQDQLLTLADAYQRLGAGAERTAFIQTAFGRDAQKLEGFLMRGRGGIMALREEADRLGITFTRADAAVVQLGQKSIKDIGKVFEGLKTQLAIGISPLISAIGQGIGEWIKAGPPLAETFKNVADGVADAALAIVEAVGAVIRGVAALADAIKFLPNKADELVGMMDRGALAEAEARTRARPTEANWRHLEALEKRAEEARKGAGAGGTDNLREAADAFDRMLAGFRDRVAGIKDAARGVADKARLASDRPGELFDRNAFDHANAEIEKLRDKLEGSIRGFGKDGVGKEVDDIRRKVEEMKPVDVFGNTARDVAARRAVVEKGLRGLRGVTEAELNDPKKTLELLEGYYRGSIMPLLVDQMAKRQKAFQEATHAAADEVERLADQLERMERWKKSWDEAQKVIESVSTPLEKFEAKMGHLGELVAAGALPWERYKLAAAAAFDELDKGNHAFQTPKAIVRGSAEDYSLMVRHELGGESDPSKRLEERVAEGNRVLQEIRSGILQLVGRERLEAGRDILSRIGAGAAPGG